MLSVLYESVQIMTLTHNIFLCLYDILKADGNFDKLVGEYLRPSTHARTWASYARTFRRTIRNHSASGSVYWIGHGRKHKNAERLHNLYMVEKFLPMVLELGNF